MFTLNDIEAIECDEELTDEGYYLSIQRAINSGSAWSFQGSYGRSMMDAISSGSCMLGPRDARDYYGNHIPSRSQVKEGTKGSFEFVAAAMGEDWAEMMRCA